jgi:hypothetical protein
MLEAVLLTLLAKVAVRVVPFEWLMRSVVELPGPGGAAQAAMARDIGRLVWRVANRPIRWAVCLPQALAAHWMLARRGVGSQIRFGIWRMDDGLTSHAWLMCGRECILGGVRGEAREAMAEYPPARRS